MNSLENTEFELTGEEYRNHKIYFHNILNEFSMEYVGEYPNYFGWYNEAIGNIDAIYSRDNETTVKVKLVFHRINDSDDVALFLRRINNWYIAAKSHNSRAFEKSRKDEKLLDEIEKANINGKTKNQIKNLEKKYK